MVLRNLPCKSVWHVYVGFVVVMFLNWFFIIFPNYHFLPIYTKKGEWEKTSLIQFSDVTQQVSARVNKSRNQVMWLLNQASYCCMLLLLLLLLRHFSRVRLCATQRRQPTRLSSLGFSRQEHWSGLPFPSPMHESEKWKWSCSVVSDSSRPHGLQPSRLLHPWDFPGNSTGVGCHCLLVWPKSELLQAASAGDFPKLRKQKRY